METTTANQQETTTKLYELIDYYEVCNRCENKSPRSITWYTSNFNQFSSYLKSHKLSFSIDAIDIKVLREYVLYLMNKTKSYDYGNHGNARDDSKTQAPSTVHGHVRTLALFDRLANEELIAKNPVKNLKPPKAPKTLVNILFCPSIVLNWPNRVDNSGSMRTYFYCTL